MNTTTTHFAEYLNRRWRCSCGYVGKNGQDARTHANQANAPQEAPVTETITPLPEQSTWRYQVVQDGPRWTVQSIKSGFIWARCDTFTEARDAAIALAAKDREDADLERHLSRSE